jgi:hypothetical protein
VIIICFIVSAGRKQNWQHNFILYRLTSVGSDYSRQKLLDLIFIGYGHCHKSCALIYVSESYGAVEDVWAALTSISRNRLMKVS